MGSILSNLSTQNVAVVVVVVSAVSYMAVQRIFISGPSSSGDVVRTSPEAGAAASGKKGKRKKAGANAQSDTGGGAPTSSSGVKPIVVPFPAVIPGAFDSTAASGQEQQGDATSKSSKSKKKKGKKAATTPVIGGGARNVPVDAQSESSATAPESHAPTPKSAPKKKSPVPKLPSVSLVDTDDTWTRVEPRRRPGAQSAAPHSRETSGTLGSDAGVSTPVTGNSSPIAEREDDDSHEPAEENRRTLAEKLLPKLRKTGVDELSAAFACYPYRNI